MKYQIEKDKMQGIPGNHVTDIVRQSAGVGKPDRHIYDEKAIAIVSELDYDFSKAADDKMMGYGVIARNHSFGSAGRGFSGKA